MGKNLLSPTSVAFILCFEMAHNTRVRGVEAKLLPLQGDRG